MQVDLLSVDGRNRAEAGKRSRVAGSRNHEPLVGRAIDALGGDGQRRRQRGECRQQPDGETSHVSAAPPGSSECASSWMSKPSLRTRRSM